MPSGPGSMGGGLWKLQALGIAVSVGGEVP